MKIRIRAIGPKPIIPLLFLGIEQGPAHTCMVPCKVMKAGSECSNVLIVDGAKIPLPIKHTSSNRCILPYHQE